MKHAGTPVSNVMMYHFQPSMNTTVISMHVCVYHCGKYPAHLWVPRWWTIFSTSVSNTWTMSITHSSLINHVQQTCITHLPAQHNSIIAMYHIPNTRVNVIKMYRAHLIVPLWWMFPTYLLNSWHIWPASTPMWLLVHVISVINHIHHTVIGQLYQQVCIIEEPYVAHLYECDDQCQASLLWEFLMIYKNTNRKNLSVLFFELVSMEL